MAKGVYATTTAAMLQKQPITASFAAHVPNAFLLKMMKSKSRGTSKMARLEFHRKVVADFENKKELENGTVWGQLGLGG